MRQQSIRFQIACCGLLLAFLAGCSDWHNPTSRPAIGNPQTDPTSIGHQIRLSVYSSDQLEGRLKSAEVREYREQQRVELKEVNGIVQRKDDTRPIHIEAARASYLSDSNHVELNGDVKIQYGALVLNAPAVSWDVEHHILTAPGKIEFQMQNSRIRGDYFRFYTVSRQWKLRNVKGMLDLTSFSNTPSIP